MRGLVIDDLKEKDVVEGFYKEVLVKGVVKRWSERMWLEVKARPAGRIRIPLNQVEVVRAFRRSRKLT